MSLLNAVLAIAIFGIAASVIMYAIDKVIVTERVLAEIRKAKKDSI